MEQHFFRPSERASATTGQQFEMSAPLELHAARRALAASPTLAMNEAVARRRAEGRRTLHLGFGEATFPLHPVLRAALMGALESTGYAPVAGVPELREAIAGYITRTRGVECSAQQVMVGPGSKPLIYALLQALDGDVLVPRPSWVSYAPQARLAGRSVSAVATDPLDHQRLTPDALADAASRARAAGGNPRILVVNSPSNPTGGMFAREDVAAITAWARAAGVTIVSDEIYAELAHGWRPHVSPASLYPEGSIITGGLSKGFSAGGWRLGYAILPSGERGEQLGKAVRALASEIWSAAPTPIEEAAIAAFTPNPDVEAYLRRSARLHGHVTHALYRTLRELAIACPKPAGGFYLYPDFAAWRAPLARLGVTTSPQLAQYLLDRWELATLPGTAFGEEPEALRLRLATSMLYGPAAQSDLWQLLARTDDLPLPGTSDEPLPLSLPELTQVQQRWNEIIADWNARK
jgi:aspartate/methionine/tyrosine aminotransferase